MLTQKFCSWLWNQMFQYAYIKALSLRCKQDFQMDLSFYERRPDRPFELLEVFDIKNVTINHSLDMKIFGVNVDILIFL